MTYSLDHCRIKGQLIREVLGYRPGIFVVPHWRATTWLIAAG